MCLCCDNTKWPSVEFVSVYVYLIDTPRPFTHENMRSYKSLDAFGYFFAGWVHTCFMQKSETGYCIVTKSII